MDDQIIDIAMAQALQTDVARTRPIAGWVVMRDPPDYPDKIIARLVTDRPPPYVLMAESWAEIQALLPPGLVRAECQPADLPEVVEIWFRHSQHGPSRWRNRAVRPMTSSSTT